MKLPTSVYSAYRGYTWSCVPNGITAADLDGFSRMVASVRGDFPDPTAVDTGIVSDGKIAAAFTMQNVPNWDANGRASDYGAFVFFPAVVSKLFDFVELISNDFFWTPSHTPATSIDYAGRQAAELPRDAVGYLQLGSRYSLMDPRAVGSILSAFCARSNRWICLMQPDGSLTVECAPWAAQ